MHYLIRLEDFYAGSPEGFEPFYGVGGVEGDGDVFKPENVKELRRFVLENTGGKGDLKGTVSRDFLYPVFFHQTVHSAPVRDVLGPF